MENFSTTRTWFGFSTWSFLITDNKLFSSPYQQIEYAKTASHATLKLHDPNFILPKMNQTLGTASGSRVTNGAGTSSSKVTVSNAENDERKRSRETAEGDQEERDVKKRRGDGDDMEMDEDDDETPAPPVPGKPTAGSGKYFTLDLFFPARLGGPPAAAVIIPASSLLYCENLPAEVTEDVLGVLFQQFVPSI